MISPFMYMSDDTCPPEAAVTQNGLVSHGGKKKKCHHLWLT